MARMIAFVRAGGRQVRVGAGDEPILEGVHAEALLLREPHPQRVAHEAARIGLLREEWEILLPEIRERELLEAAQLVGRIRREAALRVALVLHHSTSRRAGPVRRQA
jgi:hypothetical protein